MNKSRISNCTIITKFSSVKIEILALAEGGLKCLG